MYHFTCTTQQGGTCKYTLSCFKIALIARLQQFSQHGLYCTKQYFEIDIPLSIFLKCTASFLFDWRQSLPALLVSCKYDSMLFRTSIMIYSSCIRTICPIPNATFAQTVCKHDDLVKESVIFAFKSSSDSL